MNIEINILDQSVKGILKSWGSISVLNTQGEKVSPVRKRTQPTIKYQRFFNLLFIL